MDTYTNEGLTFEVTDAGPSDGRVVILLHGFPEDRHSWDKVIQPLIEAGFRALAPDQRGYSPDARPAGRRSYTVDKLVSDVLALADAAGAERFDVVGHDWGAVVAWNLAGRHPERVRSLAVTSVPHPQAFLRSLSRSDQLLRSWYMLFFQIPALPERVLSVQQGRFLARSLIRSGLSRDVSERFAGRAITASELTGPINWYRALPYDSRDRLGRVGVPTLFMWGDKERFVSRAAVEGTSAWVSGPYRFEIIPGGTHWLPTENADQIVPMILEHLESVKD